MKFRLEVIRVYSTILLLTYLAIINKCQSEASSLPIRHRSSGRGLQRADHRTRRSSSNSNETAYEQITHTAPFLVLLSSDEVSIAQLPLIDDGHMSVVYTIADSNHVISDTPRDAASSSSPSSTNVYEPTDEVEARSLTGDYAGTESNTKTAARESNGDAEGRAGPKGTDAREYEQMPSPPSNDIAASLGKSDAWSQSVARPKEGALGAAGMSRPQGEEEGPRAADAGRSGSGSRSGGGSGSSGSGDEMGMRPRRSSSADGDGDGSGGGNNEHGNGKAADQQQDVSASSGAAPNATGAVSANGDEPPGAVSESTYANVTSAAAAGHGKAAAAARERGEGRPVPAFSGASSLPAEVSAPATIAATAAAGAATGSDFEKTAPKPSDARDTAQFGDIDVHMALGYAFVADSLGRVHRVRLMPPIKSALSDPHSNSIDAAAAANDNDNDSDSDSSSISDNSVVVDERAVGQRVRANITRPNHDHDFDAASSAEQQSGGQHPTAAASGGAASRPEWLSSSSSSVAAAASTSGATDDDDSGSSQQQAQRQSRSESNQEAYWQRSSSLLLLAASSSRPKIIWPRSRRGFVVVSDAVGGTGAAAAAAADSDRQTSGPNRVAAPPRGALPVPNHSESVQARQMANGTQAAGARAVATDSTAPAGANANLISAEPAPSESEEAAASDDTEQQQQQNGRHLRTELAVDWLSNLLFVLDKYRLIVMDLDGNNELVLIDDFTPNNRPVEMRLDPGNDFLYWLQVGNFHNTIYKLDLRVLTLPTARERLFDNYINPGASQSRNLVVIGPAPATGSHLSADGNGNDASELVPLVSHHYAHPIITNLPKSTKLFIIDHKHSRIYVPLTADQQQARSPSVDETGASPATPGAEKQNKTTVSASDDAEVFAPTQDDSVTHLNNSISAPGSSQPDDAAGRVDCNATATDSVESWSPLAPRILPTQIIAFNLDGTDVGPVRGVGERGHLYNLDDMQDLTLDSNGGLMYWLTNSGRELFEEFKNGRDPTLYSAQHNLEGKRFQKVTYFGNNEYNQPTSKKSRFSIRHLMQKVSSQTVLASSASTTDRHTRSGPEPRFDGSASASTRFSRNAPYIILAVTSLIVLVIYLVYALVFQQVNNRLDTNTNGIDAGRHYRRGSSSLSGSSIGESHLDTDTAGNNTNSGFTCSSTVRRWVARPSGSSRNVDTTASTFSRPREETSDNIGSANGLPQDNNAGRSIMDNSNCYDVGNAIDEHYRDDLINNASDLFEIVDSTRLANLSKWPTDLHDLSNKLYVPAEVARDEALANIRRVSMDQLEIEKSAPLGEGHFGLVLQGTIKCTVNERNHLLASPGHSINLSVATGEPFASFTLNSPNETLTGDQLLTFGRRQIQISSSTASSSGHGSSSTSSEFVTARTTNPKELAASQQTDYLTPKSNCNSTVSDYMAENADSCISYLSMSKDTKDSRPVDPSSNKETKLRVAIKKLRENATAEEKRDFLQEAKLLANFDHPNIVHLIGISLDRGSTLIVMELMLGGDLIRYMRENTPSATNPETDLTNEDLMKICLDIVNGCCYLEGLNYIHRDLAARNCLVSSRKREERIVKLADFGLARDIYKDSYYKKLNDSAMPLKWMAPECLIEQKFTSMSDVWSFGVVMWEVMSYCQEKPYCGVEPFFMKEHLTSGARLRKPDCCSDDMYKLMLQCWQLNPKDRPTFQECRATLIEIRNSSANI